MSDRTIKLMGFRSGKAYPNEMRLVTYFDREKRKEYEFITNNFKLSEVTIARIYKSRWDIELFLKWTQAEQDHLTFVLFPFC